MSPQHVAGSIDLNEFHARLIQHLFAGGDLEIDRLHALARSALSKVDYENSRILQNLRFGEEWLLTDEYGPEPRLWYMALLGCSVTPVPDLSSNRSGVSWYVLDQALPRFDWSDGDKNRLVYGDPLPDFLRGFAGGILEKPLVGVFGGHLLHGECVVLRSRIESVEDRFRAGDPTITARLLQEGIDEPKALEYAYFDALDMLGTAIEAQQDLFLSLD